MFRADKQILFPFYPLYPLCPAGLWTVEGTSGAKPQRYGENMQTPASWSPDLDWKPSVPTTESISQLVLSDYITVFTLFTECTRWRRTSTQSERVHTHTHTHTHIQHSENDRSSCWRDLEVMLDRNTEEKNKFFNPGGCLRCELVDHMVIKVFKCFPQRVFVRTTKTESDLLYMCVMGFYIRNVLIILHLFHSEV